jgi:hypothetical protein
MIEAAIIGMLLLALAAWILLPVVRRDSGPPEVAGTMRPERTTDLLEAKHSLYRSILDLDLDHELGRVEEADYQRMRSQSVAEAHELIVALEGSDDRTKQILEDEIASARMRLRTKH